MVRAAADCDDQEPARSIGDDQGCAGQGRRFRAVRRRTRPGRRQPDEAVEEHHLLTLLQRQVGCEFRSGIKGRDHRSGQFPASVVQLERCGDQVDLALNPFARIVLGNEDDRHRQRSQHIDGLGRPDVLGGQDQVGAQRDKALDGQLAAITDIGFGRGRLRIFACPVHGNDPVARSERIHDLGDVGP